MIQAIDVYLERRKTRQYVGRLSKKKRQFVFEYEESYRWSGQPIALGPDLPLSEKRHSSLKLFPSFEDRLPSRKNPAYKEYCQDTGISLDEKDSFILLANLGQRGPSSFVFAPVYETVSFVAKDLKNFRKSLKLSMREFAGLFDISTAVIYRIENGKSSGRQILKKMSDYWKFPQLALDKIRQTGYRITDEKRAFVEDFFKKQNQ